LEQVFGFEFAAGPAITLLELDSEKVIGFFESAVLYAGLAAIALELQRYNRIGRNGFFEFKTGSRRGNVFKDCPLTASGSEFRFPLNFNQICAKLSFFFSFGSHA